MSSSYTIEHVVLFKLKNTTTSTEPSDPIAADKVISRINSLISLDTVLHITIAPIRQLRSTSSTSALSFTHVLHSRFRSKSDLASYAADPSHLRVIRQNAPLVEDILAVDWVASADLAGPPPAGSTVRMSFRKLKEGLGEEKKRSEVLEAIGGILKEEMVGWGCVSQFSFGENFSPERAKGFSVASLAVFPSAGEMDSAVDLKMEEKLKDFVDSFIKLDFVVPSE